MTFAICPFLFREEVSEPCPGCKIERSGIKEKEHEVIYTCLTDIKNKIEETKGKINQKKNLQLGLYKLKRLTSAEEEPKLDIMAKKRALKILDTIIKLYPSANESEDVQYNLDIGDAFFNLEEHHKALDKYYMASKKEPEERRVWNNIAVTMVRLGRVEEALEYYDKALELDPIFGSAWFNKGKALFKLGMKKEALNCFRKATKFSPENKSAWNNLGVTLRHLKRYNESIKCYNKALKIHSDYPWAWHNKGVALMELKKYKAAMKCFDKALHIDPSYEPAKETKRELMRKLV